MDIRELSPELKKLAKDELFEDEKRIESDLRLIKEWLSKQIHIKARMDDQWLIAFLRGSKYSLEKTKEKIDTFYTMKTAVPDFAICGSTKDKDMQEMLKKGLFTPLMNTYKPDSPRVIIVRPGVIDASTIPITSIMRANQMFVNLQMMIDDNSIIAGQTYILDMENVGFSLISQMQPALIKKMTISRETALPLRDKGSHHINTPAAVETIMNFMKSFMSEKSQKRFYVHRSVDKIYDFIPKEILPTEYGGGGGPIQKHIDAWREVMEKHEQFFLDDHLYKTDESKRPGAPKTSDILFGIEGSFRLLNVD